MSLVFLDRVVPGDCDRLATADGFEEISSPGMAASGGGSVMDRGWIKTEKDRKVTTHVQEFQEL